MAHNNLLLAANLIEGLGPQPTSAANATSTLEKVISSFFGIMSAVAVIYFTIQIILAGFAFISSRGDQNKVETARKHLTESILGLVIVITALGLGALLASLLGLKGIFDLESVFTKLQIR